MVKNEKLLGVLDIIRVLFLLLVIFIHNTNGIFVNYGVSLGHETNAPFFYYTSEYVSEVLARIAVPGFFLISGYLFFFNTKFSKDVYFQKIKRRVHSLFIPYLFWSILFAVYYFIFPVLTPSLFEELHEISFRNVIGVLSCSRDGHALNQLWFVRDLIICSLTAPIYYILLKGRFRFLFLAFVFCLWFFNFQIPYVGNYGFSSTSIFFWSIGSFLAIQQKDLLRNESYGVYLVISVIISIIDLITKETAYNLFIHNSFIVTCLLFVFSFFSSKYEMLVKYAKGGKTLSKSSFFIYAIHLPWIIIPIRKLYYYSFNPSSDQDFLLMYLTVSIATLITSFLLFKFLYKICPRFLSFITGRRLIDKR